MTEFLCAIDRFWLRIEYGIHRVDEYLALHRDDGLFAADSAARAEECQRKLDVMAVNRRFLQT
jgi:hypothetical protein